MSLTELEKAFIAALGNSEYLDSEITEPVWINCIWHGIDAAAVRGVISSLIQKGAIAQNGKNGIGPSESVVWLTDAGAEAFRELFPVEYSEKFGTCSRQ